ncbi:SurA N-terminal domain-containing protein [Nitrococcus mobilis]|uniref:Periplasmic chaperone PpiD n=1 Tax=Nitrococcus mobilis Nb-231 TaxID=314278 RepID=A4BM13_9GAMM|nr:SurA N-terminal domain-containing protein [Nitrococcus mobilis]EAR23351.1 PpiC-type peptidyl-prolyl cis-trans isomerase [Nitrococcus mobilis Nb-231]
MLQTIRDRAQGIVAYIIVGLLIIPFAFFGVYNYFTGDSNPTVATVNGIDITRAELDAAVQRQQSQLRELLGDQYNPALFDESHLRPQVLDRLVDQAVLLYFIRSQGFRVTDESLRSFIRSQPYFLADGQFSKERYRAVLRQSGYSTDQYEAQLRQQQLLRQLELGIVGTAVATKHEMARFVALERQSRDLAWLKIDSANFRDQTQVDAKAIQQYYATHKQAFEQPAQVKVSYIELSENALADQLELDDKAVQRFYEEFKDSRFTVPDARRVRHILIKLPKDASQHQIEVARGQIEALRERIVQGASFAELAQRQSQDVGSARQSGDLGFVRQGEMAKAIDEAAFKLPIGETSEPIRSRFGWHLIEVTASRAGGVKPFSEVESQIRQELLKQQSGKRFYKLSNQAANYAYEHPDSLEPLAAKFGLKIRQSNWFSQAGAKEGIASHPKVVKAAFSDEVLKQGLNSQSIDLGDEHQVILRVDQHKPAAVRPLAEVRDRVREHLVTVGASEQAQKLGAQLLEKAKSGQSLEALAEANQHARYSAVGWVRRGSNKVPAAIVERGFRLPHPSSDALALAGIELSDGGYGVVEVRGVRDGALDKLDAAERTQVRQGLQRLNAESTLQAMIHVLRQQADVEFDRGQVPSGDAP